MCLRAEETVAKVYAKKDLTCGFSLELRPVSLVCKEYFINQELKINETTF